MVGGSFLHFGFSHDADPNHKHSGLIALHPVTGALASGSRSRAPTVPGPSSA